MKAMVLGAALIAAAVLILPTLAELGMAQDQTDSYGDASLPAGDQEDGLEGFLRSLMQNASVSSAASAGEGGSVSSAAASSAADAGVSSEAAAPERGGGTSSSSAEVLQESGTETGITPEGLPDTGLGGMAE